MQQQQQMGNNNDAWQQQQQQQQSQSLVRGAQQPQQRPNGAASEGSSGGWDPYKEVALLAGDLRGKEGGDKLTLLQAIGQGGLGTVYRGEGRHKAALFTSLCLAAGCRRPPLSAPNEWVTALLPYWLVIRTWSNLEVAVKRVGGGGNGWRCHRPDISLWGELSMMPQCSNGLHDDPCLPFLYLPPCLACRQAGGANSYLLSEMPVCSNLTAG